MFKTLLKARFASYFSQFRGKKSGKGGVVLLILLGVFCLGMFGVMFGNLFSSLAAPFYFGGIGWLTFTLAGLFALTLMFIGTVFTAKAQIFDATDNELLLSMPIPPRYILLSRIAVLMIFNYVLELVVLIPAGVAWMMSYLPVTALGVVSFVLLCLALPLLAMALSSLVAWLISLITNRMRNKNTVTMVLSLLFLVAYYYAFSQMNSYITSLVAGGQEIASNLGSFAPLFWLGNGITEPNLLHVLFIFLICLVPFVVMMLILSRSFITLTTTKKGAKKKKYVAREMSSASPRKALVRKEFNRLTSSPIYMLNAGTGVLFLVAGGVMMIFFSKTVSTFLATTFGFGTGEFSVVLALVICLINAMGVFSACTVALEGKTIWVVRSMPLNTKTVLGAKLVPHYSIQCGATLFADVIAIIVFGLELVPAVGLLLMTLLFALLIGNVGLIANLKHPFLKWINETQAVKQGVAVLITMGVGLAAVLIMGGLYFFLVVGRISGSYYMLGAAAIFLILDLVTRRWINSKGVTIFENLS